MSKQLMLTIAVAVLVMISASCRCSSHRSDTAENPTGRDREKLDAFYLLDRQQRREFYRQYLFRENATFNESIRKSTEEVEFFWTETERRVSWMPLERQLEFWDFVCDMIEAEQKRVKMANPLLREFLGGIDDDTGSKAEESISVLESTFRKEIARRAGAPSVAFTKEELEVREAFPKLVSDVAAGGEKVVDRVLERAAKYARVVMSRQYPERRGRELDLRVYP